MRCNIRHAIKRAAKVPKRNNILWRTRTYLVGNMQYVSDDEGESWRDKITESLQEMGVIVFNPYHKPFIKDVDEGTQVRKRLDRAQKRQNYDFLNKKVRQIRIFDLNLVDRSDFIIAYINPTVASWGSAEEIVTAVRMKKPVFVAIKGGKRKCPLWIFGMFPHKYIYDSPDDIIKMLKQINSGRKKLDNERWKLLRKEFR
jgi:nucleoside 2-deoxyribosyltransferase